MNFLLFNTAIPFDKIMNHFTVSETREVNCLIRHRHYKGNEDNCCD